MEIKTNTKVGDKVWWVKERFTKDGKKRYVIYEGTVEEINLCEYQGALYCTLYSPAFKINPYPTVHYSYVFHSREEAEEHRKEILKLRGGGKWVVMCDGCEYAWRGRGT